MFPPNYTRVLKEDLGKDAPAWTDKILYQLNLVTDFLSIAFKKNITFPDNISNPQKTLTLTSTGSPATDTLSFLVALPAGYQPQGLQVLSCIDNSGAIVGNAVWAELQPGLVNNNVVVRAIYGLTSGHTYTITFLVY